MDILVTGILKKRKWRRNSEGEGGTQPPPGKRRAGWSQGQVFQIQMQSEVIFSEEIETGGCGSGYMTVCQNVELYTKKGNCIVREKR